MKQYPKPVTKQSTLRIIQQIDNAVCKFNEKDNNFGIGFFCYIRYHNKNIPVLVTTYGTINENYLQNNNCINVFIKNEIIPIYFGKTYYINKSYDISIIEINDINIEKLNILEIEKSLYDKTKELMYYNESMYIIHYDGLKENCVSYGIINRLNKSELLCSCNINSKSNGSPIFDLFNNKLIGIYKKNTGCYAKGISLKFIIHEFTNKLGNSKQILKLNGAFENEIDFVINVEEHDINKKIYFLNNFDTDDNKSESNNNYENIKGLNNQNSELYVNKEKCEYKRYYIPEKEGKYDIKLKFDFKLTDASYMFAGCENIINIKFIVFNSKYITNMKYMFGGCKNLKNINFFLLIKVM